jgi:hypothetical protein
MKHLATFILTAAASATSLAAQSGDLRYLAESRSMVNVVVRAPLNSQLHGTIQSHVNSLIQDDWSLHFFYIDPKTVTKMHESNVFKKLFGESGWAVLLPDGSLVASGNAAPSKDDFEKIILSTDLDKPIPRLRQFLKQHPNNIDARSELIKLLRASAYRRTKQELNITQKSMWEGKDDKQYGLLPRAGFAMPDVEQLKETELKPEKDLIIWAKYGQELLDAFQNETWHQMNFWEISPNATLPLEVCSPTMKTVFRRIKPQIEEAIAALPGSEKLWRLWLHVQACIDSQNYNFSFFDSIEAPPDVAGISWPPAGAVVPLTKYFYGQKNWDVILKITTFNFEYIKRQIDMKNNTAKYVPAYNVAIYVDWHGLFKPRLESLIMLGMLNEADALVTLLHSTEDGRTLVNSAIQSAKNLGAANLGDKWLLLVGGVQ